MQTYKPGWISLITDFGEEDWFVGSMKGVIASHNPRLRTVDITHRIAPGDIRRAALVLKCAYRFFPPGTVHLVVVDPGVGTDRAVLVVEGREHIFVAPDNGVLSYVLPELGEKKFYQAANPDLFREKISDTFHGRDIFAPLAAYLAEGFPPSETGPSLKEGEEPITLPPPYLEALDRDRWLGEIIMEDRFGNLITSLPSNLLDEAFVPHPPDFVRLLVKTERLEIPFVSSYGSVKEGKPLIIRGSCGYLELAVNGGNAAEKLGLKVGDRIVIESRKGETKNEK